MATPTGRGGGSLSWQRVPLSRLALLVNRDSAVILYSAVISIIMHYTSRLTGHERRDNGTHCQDNALLPPRRGGVAVYYIRYFCKVGNFQHPLEERLAQTTKSYPVRLFQHLRH